MQLHYANEAEEKLENIKSDIRYCRERIEIIRSTLTRTNIQLTYDKIQSSPNPNRMIDGICNILEFENELSRLIQEGTEFIGQLDSDQLQEICILYYIENRKVSYIARRMNYSWQHIYRLLNKASIQLAERI